MLVDVLVLFYHPGVIPVSRHAKTGTHKHDARLTTCWVYILASRRHGTLYIGVTNSLERRIAEHRGGEVPGFTKTHGVNRLVYYCGFGEPMPAIGFEKRLKRWRRDWKVRLIEEDNPHWDDLYLQSIAPDSPTRCVWVPDSRYAPSGMTPKWVGPLR